MDEAVGACLRVAAIGGREEHARGTPRAERAARLGRREALCGAVGGGTQRGSREDGAGDVSTAGASETSDEERNERAPSSRLGLWGCSPAIC